MSGVSAAERDGMTPQELKAALSKRAAELGALPRRRRPSRRALPCPLGYTRHARPDAPRTSRLAAHTPRDASHAGVGCRAAAHTCALMSQG